ncbi:GNAT family N-acetyltransferase, partial [Xanthomonas arboricola]
MAPVALPSLWRELPTLRGQHALLEPLQAAHADGLRGALGDGALSRLWYTGVPAPAQVDDYVGAALDAQADGRVLPYVVRDAAGEVVGCTRYYGLDATVPKLSIGYTWYAPR